MAAIGTLQLTLAIIAEDGQVGESAANRAVAFFPDVAGKFRLKVSGFFCQHEAIENSQKKMQRGRRNPQFHRLVGELKIPLAVTHEEQGRYSRIPLR